MDQQGIIKVTGNVHAVLKDPYGYVKDERRFQNMVVTTGLNHIASRLLAAPPAPVGTVMSHMAIGVGTTEPALGQEQLTTQLGNRVLFDAGGFTVSNNTIQFIATFATGYTGAVTEAGVFNAATHVAGTSFMLCRSKFLQINKSDDDTLTITWVVTLS